MILHADLDSFYASVEQRDRPELRGRPMAVGGGVVLAASYEAKAFGVHGGMNGRQARQLCPQLIVVEAHFDAYVEASRRVFAIFHDTTPLVEGLSIDEAFLDVGGLGAVSGTPVEIGVRLRERVRREVGLAITVGIAGTKFLAKVASAVAKPDGLKLVPRGEEQRFLHPLPVQRLWGVGPKTAEQLHARGLFTVGEVAALDISTLTTMLGKASGRHLHALAHNRDPRPVVVGRRRRSIGAQRALGSRGRTAEQLDADLIGLAERVCGRMRKAGRLGRTVTVRVRFADFTAVSRSHSLARPTDSTEAVLGAARRLAAALRSEIEACGITLIGISVGNLDDSAHEQLELPFTRPTTDHVLDDVRARFGTAALARGTLLHHRPGLQMPMLDQD